MKKTISIQLVIMLLAITQATCQSGGIKVSPGTKMTLNQGSTMKITGGGNLLLQDDLSTSPSFLQKGTLSFAGGGDAKVEQYLSKDVWHIVSSPVQDEVNGTYNWIYFYNWDESTYSWNFMNQPTTQPLEPGHGYYAWAYTTDPNGTFPPSPDSTVLSGTLNHQDINLSLSVTDISPKSGWNLIGNPFPVALDWNGDASWNLTNLDATIWIWDPVAGNHKVWNHTSGGTLQSGAIAATQGFWVHADDTTGTTATSLTLPVSQRMHSNNSFYKNSGAYIPNQLKLVVQGNTAENDECIIGFHESATALPNGQLDALYLEGGETAPTMYSIVFGKSYAMKQLPSWEEYNTVQLNFKANILGNYTISAAWIESFPQDLPIWLEDKQENSFLDLRQQSQYNFVTGLDDAPQRFIVHFGNPLGINDLNSSNLANIYAYGTKVYMDIYSEEFDEGLCTIYNMVGKKVTEAKVTKGLNEIPAPFNKGFYLVTLNSPKVFLSDKVFIK